MNARSLCGLLTLFAACGGSSEKPQDPAKATVNAQSEPQEQAAKQYSMRSLQVEFKERRYREHALWKAEAEVVGSDTERQIAGDPALLKLCAGEAKAVERASIEPGHTERKSRTYTCMDTRGSGHYVSEYPSMNLSSTYATKYELMATMHVGQAWSGSHGDGLGKSERACLVQETRFCGEGVATLCVSSFPKRMIWLRQHYCRDQGWRGHEYVIVADGEREMHGWSSQVVVDGTEYPDVPMVEPLPTAAGAVLDAKRVWQAAGEPPRR
jgi:hypothetical protein